MSLAKDIIDRFDSLIEAIEELPAHNTYLYRRPKSLLPEDTPALVIWLRTKVPNPRTTHWFDGIYTIGISWHEESVEEAETQEMDTDLSENLMERIELIEQVIRDLSIDGWDLEAAWQVVPGATTYVEPLRESGLTEGYTLDVLVSVTESGG